ncbi:MAG: YdcF family protein [Deltaproteobacteria bacterium]|nr:YdcF family protein [Deltaproteobacteria bacterium]
MLLVALAGVACRRDDPAAPVADTAPEEEEDTGLAVPALDPGKCGAVEGDESPMVLDRTFVPASTGRKLEDKAFPIFSELEADPALLSRLRADATLSGIAAARETRLKDARSCADTACAAASVAWTDDERAAAADAAVAALGDALPAFARDRVRKSGSFNVDAALDDAALVRKAIADGLSRAALAATRDVSPEMRAKAVTDALASRSSPMAFFEPTLALALSTLEADGRDEAIRYEPLASGENAAAVAAIPSIAWASFPFAAIVVPGLGPGDPETALSEGGRARCDLAAARFRAGIAPLVVLSGGHVHPDRTRFAEAIEMKKYLRSIGVPEAALLVDPHARHTTTNLRNTSRLLLRYGVPAERPVLVTTDAFQSVYIIGRPFAVRCRDEIGLVPWRKLASLSINDTCMLPSRVSLTVEARDPLDP